MAVVDRVGVCVTCGQSVRVENAPDYVFTIPRRVPSQNDHLHNMGGARWAYKKAREAWRIDLRNSMLLGRVPKTDGRRRIKLTRLYTGRERERDRGNLVGGMKLVVDAMVLEGLLCDDSPRWCDDEYAQERADVTGLRVEVWEVADAKP